MRFVAYVILTCVLILGCLSDEVADEKDFNKKAIQKESSTTLMEPDKSTEVFESCMDIEDRSERDKCRRDIVRALDDPSLCENVELRFWRESCYITFGARRDDIGYCDKIKTADFKGICEAGVKKDPSICANLSESMWIDQCYGFVAKKMDDPGICEGIKHQIEKDECYSAIAVERNDISVCKGEGHECKLLYGLAKKDWSFCSELQPTQEADWCYWFMAINISDQSICKNIYGATMKSKCIGALAQISGDISNCELITDPRSSKDECMAAFAGRGDDPGACTEFEEKRTIMNCLREMVERLDDPAVCAAYPEIQFKSNCYTTLAKRLGDVEICAKARWGEDAETCAIEVKGDASACKTIVNNTESCLLHIGRATKDPSPCEMMEEGILKSVCFSDVAEAISDPDLCLRAKNTNDKIHCIVEVAEDLEDPKVCEKYPSSLCYLQVAKINGDATLCEKTIGLHKEICDRYTLT